MAGDADAPSTPKVPPPTQLTVDNLQVRDGHLAWTGSTSDGIQLDVDNVLVVLSPQAKGSSFITCCLRELPSESERPFELVFLRSDALPDQLGEKHLFNQLPAHLRSGEQGNQVDFIVSTKAGTERALDFWQLVLQPLWALVQEQLGAPSQSTSGATTPAAGTQEHVLITQSADSVPQFARSLWSSAQQQQQEQQDSPHEAAKSRTVVLLSGDGGVVDLLNGRQDDSLSSLPTPLPLIALLPLGTGNALFHSLHKPAYSSPGPSPLVLGLRTLFHGSPASLPVFRASFSPGSHVVAPGSEDTSSAAAEDPMTATTSTKQPRPVSHLDGAIVASYGFHASLVYESDTPAYRVHGDKRFGMVAQELLRDSRPYTAHVELRRSGPSASASASVSGSSAVSGSGSSGLEPIPREEHAYVLTTPLSNLERTFTISPASKPLDGQLRTVHFGNIGGQRAMEAMMKAYDGGEHVDVKWDDGERIYYEDVDEIKITIKEEDARWRKVCVDGTIVDVPTGGQMDVKNLEKSPLQILVDPSIVKS